MLGEISEPVGTFRLSRFRLATIIIVVNVNIGH
jgi:hypothetical protein